MAGDPARYGARGDGVTDDGPALRRCLLENDVVKLSRPPGGVGYAVWADAPGFTPLPLRTNQKLVGRADAPLIRRGAINPFAVLLMNEDTRAGNDGIEIHDLVIAGRKFDFRRLDIYRDVMTAISVRSLVTEGRSAWFMMRNCRVIQWPGPALACMNVTDFHVGRNVVTRPHRGGLIFHKACARGEVLANRVTDAGDDCIAFNAPNEEGRANDVLVRHNIVSGKLYPDVPVPPGEPFECNAALSVRGGANIRMRNNLVLYTYAARHRRTRVTPLGAPREALHVRHWGDNAAESVEVYRNVVRRSGAEGAKVWPGAGGELRENRAYRTGAKAWDVREPSFAVAGNAPES